MEATPPQTGGDQTGNPEGGGTEIAVKEEIDWDARDDEAAITPPLLDEDAQGMTRHPRPGGDEAASHSRTSS